MVINGNVEIGAPSLDLGVQVGLGGGPYGGANCVGGAVPRSASSSWASWGPGARTLHAAVGRKEGGRQVQVCTPVHRSQLAQRGQDCVHGTATAYWQALYV